MAIIQTEVIAEKEVTEEDENNLMIDEEKIKTDNDPDNSPLTPSSASSNPDSLVLTNSSKENPIQSQIELKSSPEDSQSKFTQK